MKSLSGDPFKAPPSSNHSIQSPQPNDLLKPVEAATILRISEQTLAEWRCHGRHGLPYIKIGDKPTGGKILYRRCDIEDFIAKRVRNVAKD